MSKCKINWDRVSQNPATAGQTSTRKFEYQDAEGNQRIGFRLCLERTDLSPYERMAGQSPFLFVNLMTRSIEEELAFEKLFDEKKLPPIDAERRMVDCEPFIRFYSNDSTSGKFQAGDPVVGPDGKEIIYEEISVDVLLKPNGDTINSKGQITATANGNLDWQITQNWAMKAKDYFGDGVPNPINEEPPITPPVPTPPNNNQRPRRTF